MPFFKSMPENAGPPTIFNTYPDIYGPFSQMSQVLMNGPSPLSPGERELIFAYAAGVAGCKFVYAAHCAVAIAWGAEEGLLDKLLDDLDSAPVEAKLKALLRFAQKLTLTPGEMSQADADAVFEAGWGPLQTGPIKNLDLVQELYTLSKSHPECELKWIRAHDGSRWNEYADALASSYST